MNLKNLLPLLLKVDILDVDQNHISSIRLENRVKCFCII